MIVPILILTISIVVLYKFRSIWIPLFNKTPDEDLLKAIHRIQSIQQLCPKCGEEMEGGRAIINYRDDTLPFLSPHEVPTFLRTNIRMGPTLTGNPFYPEPKKVYRCHTCGVIMDVN
jgi:hypothetical protein